MFKMKFDGCGRSLDVAKHIATPVLQDELRVTGVASEPAVVNVGLKPIEPSLDRVDPRRGESLILFLPAVCCRTCDLDVLRSNARRAPQFELLEKELLVFLNRLRRARDRLFTFTLLFHCEVPIIHDAAHRTHTGCPSKSINKRKASGFNCWRCDRAR